jgi:hypothetical protein
MAQTERNEHANGSTTQRLVNKLSGHPQCLPVTRAHPSAKTVELLPCRFQAVHQLQQQDVGARTQYSHLFRCFVSEVVRVLSAGLAF